MTIDTRIEQDIDIDAPVDVVWHTITDPDQIPKWFAETATFDPRPGGPGTLTFTDETGQKVVAEIVVEALERPHRFAFQWDSVLVEFLLVDLGGERTRLTVRETGLDALDWPDERKAAYAADHRGGWAHHLGRLQELFADAGASQRR